LVGKGVRLQYTPNGSSSPASPLSNYYYPNKWLKLQRVGSNFTASQSLDGVNWSVIAKKTFTMATAATIGLFVTSHNTGQYSSVGFDNVSVSGGVTLPTNDFSMAANPTPVSVAAGSSGTTSISTALVSGVAENVALSASGLPAGVSAGFTPTSVTTGGSSSLKLTVGPSVAPGSYPITVTGTALSATHSINVTLSVPTPASNDFSIAANPTTVGVVAGNSGTTSINTALVSGSAESISLGASGMPGGVTVGFSPTSVTAGGSSTLTFTVGSGVAPGTYPISVTGTAASATHSTSVSLTVSSPGSLPAPWFDTDIGAPSPAGSAGYAGGVFTVAGSGADIFGTSDQFNYLYQNTSSNGTLIARVASETNAGSANDKAGIMWKASTTAGSPYILIETSYQGVIKVQYNFNGSVSGATYTFPNVWMKLVRSGSLFSAYISPDGLTWTAVVTNKSLTTITTASTVGLFECSHKAGSLGTATFDNVSFTPGP
jgi:regulation of enolase protein 1 (concanavalin A-like superfamily)